MRAAVLDRTVVHAHEHAGAAFALLLKIRRALEKYRTHVTLTDTFK